MVVEYSRLFVGERHGYLRRMNVYGDRIANGERLRQEERPKSGTVLKPAKARVFSHDLRFISELLIREIITRLPVASDNELALHNHGSLLIHLATSCLPN